MGVETATRAGSVALTRGGHTLARRRGDASLSHSVVLLKLVADVLTEARASLNDVECFAVAAGPGSFTGLRIGLATIKGFAATLDRACAGVPTLEAVALSAGASDHTVALIPAGRGEVYAQAFAVGAGGEVISLNDATHLAPEELLRRFAHAETLKWAGEGALTQADLIRREAQRWGRTFYDVGGRPADVGRGSGAWTLAAPPESLAECVCELARRELRHAPAGTLKAEELRAVYLRPSDAEVNQGGGS